MTNYNDGKIHGWNGGECPVHPKMVVKVWLRCGAIATKVAGFWCWSHGGDDSDIAAFQVVKTYREPKTIWVTEYDDGPSFIYQSEDLAEHYAGSSTTRIAVKYVEVIE